MLIAKRIERGDLIRGDGLVGPAEQTQDRIPQIIPPDVLDTMTRLVLVNAIYLKAPWEEPFETNLTADLPFRVEGDEFDVPTMTGQPQATLAEGDGWRAARILYAGQELAMTLVLPDEGRLADVEASLADGGLEELLGAGARAAVDAR